MVVADLGPPATMRLIGVFAYELARQNTCLGPPVASVLARRRPLRASVVHGKKFFVRRALVMSAVNSGLRNRRYRGSSNETCPIFIFRLAKREGAKPEAQQRFQRKESVLALCA